MAELGGSAPEQTALLLPVVGDRATQPLDRQRRRLPALENCLRDVRRQEGEPENPADVTAGDADFAGDIFY
jgi:hypothetical protein